MAPQLCWTSGALLDRLRSFFCTWIDPEIFVEGAFVSALETASLAISGEQHCYAGEHFPVDALSMEEQKSLEEAISQRLQALDSARNSHEKGETQGRSARFLSCGHSPFLREYSEWVVALPLPSTSQGASSVFRTPLGDEREKVAPEVDGVYGQPNRCVHVPVALTLAALRGCTGTAATALRLDRPLDECVAKKAVLNMNTLSAAVVESAAGSALTVRALLSAAHALEDCLEQLTPLFVPTRGEDLMETKASHASQAEVEVTAFRTKTRALECKVEALCILAESLIGTLTALRNTVLAVKCQANGAASSAQQPVVAVAIQSLEGRFADAVEGTASIVSRSSKLLAAAEEYLKFNLSATASGEARESTASQIPTYIVRFSRVKSEFLTTCRETVESLHALNK